MIYTIMSVSPQLMQGLEWLLTVVGMPAKIQHTTFKIIENEVLHTNERAAEKRVLQRKINKKRRPIHWRCGF